MLKCTPNRLLLLCALIASGTTALRAQAPASLLKDINPGAGDGLSYNNASARLNGNVYFTADASGYQNLLWATDGTEAGTRLVAPASAALYVEEMVATGNRVVFEGLKGTFPALFATDVSGTGASMIRLFAGQEIFNLSNRPQDGKVLFATEPASGGASAFWVSDGTGAGTLKLGDFAMKEGFMYHSPYLNKTVVVEQSTNFDQAPPVITDGTPAGTQLLKDALAGMVATFYSIDGAAGAGDLLFVDGTVDVNGFLYSRTYAIDSTAAQEIQVFGNLRRAYKNGDFYFLVTESEVLRYDKTANKLTTLNSNFDYFCDPVQAGGKLYFTTQDNEVWESDGTAAGTKKRSTTGTGNFNYDPRIWVFGDSLFYYSTGNSLTLRVVNLANSADSLFAEVYQSSSLLLVPQLWKFGNTFVFPKYTGAYGYELWASPKPFVGAFDPAPAREPLPLAPNPTSGICRLPSSIGTGNAYIRVFDAQGRLVRARAFDSNPTLDLSACSPGIYTVIVEGQDGKVYSGNLCRQ